MATAQAIRSLVWETHRTLSGLTGEARGMADVLAGIARWGHGPVNRIAAQPDPICRHLDHSLALARQQGGGDLIAAIEAARPHLCWVTYDGYRRAEIGERFPTAHAFATIIGSTGIIPADDFELGLFLIAPRTLYRDHRHPAPELYAPMTGPTGWRFGVNSAWVTREAHQPVWNEPMAVHATRVGEAPFLCIFCWTQDVGEPSRVVAADDWAAIEGEL